MSFGKLLAILSTYEYMDVYHYYFCLGVSKTFNATLDIDKRC